MALKGNSGFRYTPPGGTEKEHRLAWPMELVPTGGLTVFRRTHRREVTALGYGHREVWTVGDGRDEIEAVLRFDRYPSDLLDMLEEAADGTTLNYFPDLDVDTSYPMDLIGMGEMVEVTEDRDRYVEAEYQTRLRFRDASANGDGFDPLLRPVLLQLEAGALTVEDDGTFSRNSTATYRDDQGLLQTAASGEIRDGHYTEDGVRSIRLEASRTNELTRSEALDHADWTKTDVTVTADQQTGPDGATALDEIVEDATTASHRVEQDATLTADATYAFSTWAMAGARNWTLLRLHEVGAFANRVDAWFNLSTGAVGTTQDNGTGSFSRAYVEDWTDAAAGLYRIVLVGSIGNSATSIRGQIFVSDADGSTSHAGDGSSSLYAGYAQLEDQAEAASSYIATTTSSATRSADSFSVDFRHAPQEMTIYWKWQEGGTKAGGQNAYWHIGGPNFGSDPRFRALGQSDTITLAYDDGATDTNANRTAPDIGQTGEGRAVLSPTSVLLGVSIDGGAEATDSSSHSNLVDAWSAETLSIGIAPDDSRAGFADFSHLVIAPGTRTLAEMRKLAGTD